MTKQVLPYPYVDASDLAPFKRWLIGSPPQGVRALRYHMEIYTALAAAVESRLDHLHAHLAEALGPHCETEEEQAKRATRMITLATMAVLGNAIAYAVDVDETNDFLDFCRQVMATHHRCRTVEGSQQTHRTTRFDFPN